MRKVWVAVDVACLECGGGNLATHVLGVYDTAEEAAAQLDRSRHATEALWASYAFVVCETEWNPDHVEVADGVT